MSPRKLIATAIVAGMLLPTLAFAETSTSSIATLLEQIRALQAQMLALQTQQQTAVLNLLTTLKQGDVGENVKTLQQLLARDPLIYPEGKVTGFFGPLTAKAIKRFQKRHGLGQIGNVGPRTLKLLNKLFGHIGTSTKDRENEDNDDHGRGPCGTPPGQLTAPGFLKNFGPNGGKEFKGRDHSTLPPCVGTTTPPIVDTIAPIISGVTISGLSSTTASVAWNTNEAATGKIYHSTSTPVDLLTALTQNNALLATSHLFNLVGLTASSTYFFVLESKDATNNTSTTSSASFATMN